MDFLLITQNKFLSLSFQTLLQPFTSLACCWTCGPGNLSILTIPASMDGGRRDSIKVGTFGGREYRLGSIVGIETEPTQLDVYEQMTNRPSIADVKVEASRRKSVSNRQLTGASQITTRQSIIPIVLVTILFFMWGFAYGLLDVL